MKRLVGGLVLFILALACAAIWGASTSPELVTSFSKAYAAWLATPTPDFLLTSTPTPTACPHFQLPTPVVYPNTLPPWRDVEVDLYRMANNKINCRNYSGS